VKDFLVNSGPILAAIRSPRFGSRGSLCRTAMAAILLSTNVAVEASDGGLRDDLLRTIILEGHHCADIVDIEYPAAAEYTVSCSNAKRFQIRLTLDGIVEVNVLGVDGAAATREPLEHEETVKRMLTAVVHLADEKCGAVVDVIRNKTTDHVVVCDNGSRYRVQVSSSGNTSVDAH